MELLSPEFTYKALLLVQVLHLLHHRLVKRHISFIEVITAGVLCVPPATQAPAYILPVTHIILIVIQIIGSLFIYRLSPDWENRHDG